MSADRWSARSPPRVRDATDADPLLPEDLELAPQEPAVDRAAPRRQPAVGGIDLGCSRVAVDGTHESTGVSDVDRDVEPSPRRVAGQSSARQTSSKATRRRSSRSFVRPTYCANCSGRTTFAESSSTSPTAVTTRISAWSNCCDGDARRSTRSTPLAIRPAPSARSVRPSPWPAASSAWSSTTSTRRSLPSRIPTNRNRHRRSCESALHVPRRRRRRHAGLHQEGAGQGQGHTGRPDLVPAGSPGVPVRLDRRSVLRRRTVRGIPRLWVRR